MRSSLLLLINLGFQTSTIATSDHPARLTLTSTRAESSNTRAPFDKRVDSIATITLGPQSTYIATPAKDAPKPPEDDFVIVPAGDAGSEGVDFIFGENLQKRMQDICKKKCKDKNAGSAGCVSAIKELIPVNEKSAVQKRAIFTVTAVAVGVALQAIVTGIIAMLGVALAVLTGGLINAIHAPKSNIDQAAQPTAATTLAFLTDAKAKPTNVPVDSGDVLVTPSIEPGDDGDILINASKDLVQRTRDYIGMHSNGDQHCPAQPSKRRANWPLLHARVPELTEEQWQCLLSASTTIVGGIVTTLQEWYRTNIRRGVNIEPQGRGALVLLNQVDRQVANLRPRGASDQVWRNALIVATSQAVYQNIYKQAIKPAMKMVLKIDDCPPTSWFTCASATCNGKNNKCAGDSPLKGCKCEDHGDDDNPTLGCPRVACDVCGGEAGDSKCRGIKGNDNKDILKDCDCWAVDDEMPLLLSKEQIDAGEAALSGLNDLPDNPPLPYDGPIDDNGKPLAHCELRRDLEGRADSKGLADVETDFFKSLVQRTVCKDYANDPSKSFDQTLTKKDADDKYKDSYNGWTFMFKWDDKPGVCQQGQTCQTIFESFLHSDSNCSPNSHSMAKSGELDLNCGHARYIINPASPSNKPTPPPRDDCPALYPGMDSKDDASQKWWDDNKCNKKCPGKGGEGKQYDCKPADQGWNKDLNVCYCMEQSCKDSGQDMCSNPKKKNPFKGNNSIGRRH